MDKKTYEAPRVTKVSLDVTNSVLAVCRSSSISDPFDDCGDEGMCAFPRLP